MCFHSFPRFISSNITSPL
uniref:Uncharacterized protein n=1 Tax=Anguilla anguilla TaxID=7936 RepID=A0A0E9PIL8_ANGAN